MKRYCKHCFHPFEGRENRLFCSVSCKTKHNNSLAKTRNANLKRVFTIVKANRQALAQLYELFDTQPVSVELLQKAGIRLAYTSQLTANGVYVYDDYAIKSIGNNQFQIDKLQKL